MECFQFEMDPENRVFMRSPAGKKIVSDQLRTAVKTRLTKKQRATFYLYYVKKLHMEEIAQVQSVNVSTVSRSLKRARRRVDGYMETVMPEIRQRNLRKA